MDKSAELKRPAGEPVDGTGDAKRGRFDAPPPVSTALSAAQIAAMVEEAKRKLEEKKRLVAEGGEPAVAAAPLAAAPVLPWLAGGRPGPSARPPGSGASAVFSPSPATVGTALPAPGGLVGSTSASSLTEAVQAAKAAAVARLAALQARPPAGVAATETAGASLSSGATMLVRPAAPLALSLPRPPGPGLVLPMGGQNRPPPIPPVQTPSALPSTSGSPRPLSEPPTPTPLATTGAKDTPPTSSATSSDVPKTSTSKAMAVYFDELGRPVDAEGNLITLLPRESVTTLKINQRAKQAKKSDKATNDLEAMKERGENPYWDPALAAAKQPGAKDRSKAFRFIEPGTIERRGAELRAKAQLEKLQKEIEARARQAGIEQLVDRTVIEAAQNAEKQIPQVEWWDLYYIKGDRYPAMDAAAPLSSEEGMAVDSKPALSETMAGLFRLELVSHLVHHPISTKPPREEAPAKPKEMFLTDAERKKLRRQRKLQAEKEKQEMIRLGLMKAPAPKVKISNLMRVLGNEAIKDPTMVEKNVRQQIADRLEAHKAANEARKLTPEQRREKASKKESQDRAKDTVVAVFRINDLSHPQRRFKVDINAQQLFLTGAAVATSDMSVVIVEGGPKAVKAYKKLMLRRIKWSEDPSGVVGGAGSADEADDDEANEDDDDDAPNKSRSAATPGSAIASGKSATNRCVLVWEGSVKEPQFHGFRFRQCAYEQQARDVLKRARAEHYWDFAKNYVDKEF